MSGAADGEDACTLVHEGAPVARLTPISPSWQPCKETIATGEWFVLSRFAYVRLYEGALVVESPLAHARITLFEPAVAALSRLTEPRTSDDLCRLVPVLPAAVIEALLALLAGERIVCRVSAEGVSAEEAQPTLVQWEFHDLLFHARSRQGRHDYSYGASFRHDGVIAPLAALKPAMAAERIPLCRPDLEQLAQQDPPFTRVLEARTSRRRHGERPLTVAQVGEFLYRVARVRRLFPVSAERGVPYEYSSRPYPSAGAGYALELYLVVDHCEGLPTGLYHYEPGSHALEVLTTGRTAELEELLEDARFAAAMPKQPQILIVLAARFQRLSWKYDAIAYALLLKDTGVLYQTMYLAATAMGLAGCALGCGHSDLFSRAAGTDYLAESSVGEFILGSASPAPGLL